MFCDYASVGNFAVSPSAITAGDSEALFRMLVTTAMFQRRQDQQILRVLQGISAPMAAELTDQAGLQRLVRASPCPHVKSVASLRERCDLMKDPSTRRGDCRHRPGDDCHLKEHTVVLKRYGHFGKVPTSIALSIVESGARDLRDLFERSIATHRTRLGRAVALETSLCEAWRVNQKIASMFLSAVTNPDLSPGCTVPWARKIDWSYFVVVDSNVDLFFSSLGYEGRSTYDARRAFIRALAARIDLRDLDPRLRSFNPRLVQQAMYLFMSASNRRTLASDCSRLGSSACRQCPSSLRARCGLRAPN